MFIAFPPTFVFPSGLPKTFLPTHHIFYSQRLLDMKDGLPKYARHKEDGTPTVDESENGPELESEERRANRKGSIGVDHTPKRSNAY
jgi:hypothetical protein